MYLLFGLSHLILVKNNAGKSFLIFWIFLLFFSEFSCLGRVRTEFETKFFFLFFGLSHPVLVKINAKKGFFKFLNFFAIFFQSFHPWIWYERNSGLKFFFLFFGLSRPVLAKNKARKGFFLCFFLFLSEFSCLSQVWTEFGTKFLFFCLFWPI